MPIFLDAQSVVTLQSTLLSLLSAARADLWTHEEDTAIWHNLRSSILEDHFHIRLATVPEAKELFTIHLGGFFLVVTGSVSPCAGGHLGFAISALFCMGCQDCFSNLCLRYITPKTSEGETETWKCMAYTPYKFVAPTPQSQPAEHTLVQVKRNLGKGWIPRQAPPAALTPQLLDDSKSNTAF